MSNNDRIVNTTSGYHSRLDLSKPCIGVVKDNRDNERMGRLKVWIRDSTSPENDSSGWIWASYCSPFAGATEASTLGGNYSSYDDTQKSYGFWAVPPDIDNEVIVIFIGGDIKKAYWIGCIYHKNMNQMVPGISEGAAYQANQDPFNAEPSASIPVAEYNKLSLNPKLRPYYEPLAQGLAKQGLLSDDLRGAGTSSARRESPSNVFGLLTPGGNQLIMDDGEDSTLIRFRTKSGVQILLSETTGNIYMITKDGNNWIELGNDGYIDMYAANDISIRSEGNLNLRADNNINLEAGNGINLKSNGDNGIKLECTIGDINAIAKDIFVTSTGSTNLKSRTNLNVKSDNITSFTSDNSIVFNAPLITSNSDVSGIIPPEAITQPSVQKLDLDVIFAGDESIVVESNVNTITSRMPHHEPWPGHAVVVKGTRELVEEGESRATVGSVSERPASPLPVVGTPSKGMNEGVYLPKGYTKDNKPLYEYSGTTTDLKPVNDLISSDAGIAFISRFEGFSSNSIS